MPAKMMFPTNAKMTALVCSGLSRPKVKYGARLSPGRNSMAAISVPTSMPTTAHTTAARKKSRGVRSS